MLLDEVAVVAREHDDGPLVAPELAQCFAQTPEVLVERSNQAEVLPMGLLDTTAALGASGRDATRGVRGVGRLIEKGRTVLGTAGRSHALVHIELAQPRGRLSRAVRCFESEDEQEGFVGRADELDREVRRDIVDEAGRSGPLAVELEGRVEVATLARVARRVVEAGTRPCLDAHVPLAHVSRSIAGTSQRACIGRQVGRELGSVVEDSVLVRVATRQEAGAGGRAERSHNEGVAETHAFVRKAVELRRLDPRGAGLFAQLSLDDTEPIPALIVGDQHDEAWTRARPASKDETEQTQQPHSFPHGARIPAPSSMSNSPSAITRWASAVG
jgi:hypothetical protein